MKIKRFPRLDGDLAWFELCKDKNEDIGKKLKSDINVDICVVGAGIAGFSTANFLAKQYPNSKIALVEALKIGQGTSSRNAGFIIDLPHNVDGFEPNLEHDLKIYELNCFAIDILDKIVKENNIQCDWQKIGKYMCAHESSNLQGLDNFEKHLKPCGFEFQRIKGKDLEARLGTSYYKEAVFTPNNILMNPSALMRGLIKSLPKNVEVFEQSPIIEVKYGKQKVLKSYAGSATCEILVLALDTYLEEFGLVKNRQAPIFTYGSLTQRLSDEEYERYFKDIKPYGLTSAHPAGTTVRFTPDRRIFIRNVLDFMPNLTCSEHDLRRAFEQHRLSFEARFPNLKHKNFEFTWGGTLCMTLNHESVFGEIDDNVFAMSGSNGVGMAKGVYLGYYMADLIAKKSSENLDFIIKHNKANFIPPEPLRSIGAKIRLWYEQKNAANDI